MTQTTSHIPVEEARTLAGALRLRAGRTPDRTAYREFEREAGAWRALSWREAAERAARWQAGLRRMDLRPGERVAVMLRNCIDWVTFDQAALGLGLVTVPIYTNDRTDNIAYILRDAGVRLLLIEGDEQWRALAPAARALESLSAVVTLNPVEAGDTGVAVHHAAEWLPADAPPFEAVPLDGSSLATIVYTSGTTGRPKGVMLTHRNILWNIGVALKALPVTPDDEFLSFLPLSHTFERTTGYYVSVVAGSTMAFARSIEELAEDLVTIRPTILVSVPRIFERVHGRIRDKLETDSALARRLFQVAVATGWKRFEHQQGRAGWSPSLLLWPVWERLVARKVQARLGGRLNYAASGGAALSPDIAKMFIGLGINIVQGYGLTETSPVISGNRLDDNIPASVGRPLEGIETRVSDNDELIVRSPAVMAGYWNNEAATREAIDDEGWFHTGDQVRIDEDGHIFITGRLKDIIVLANGEKVPPADMELAIAMDPLIEQVMVVGEGRPFLAALAVLNPEALETVAGEKDLDAGSPSTLRSPAIIDEVLVRIRKGLSAFPGYAQIHAVGLVAEPWTIENGMMTPTMKLKRNLLMEAHREMLEEIYAGH